MLRSLWTHLRRHAVPASLALGASQLLCKPTIAVLETEHDESVANNLVLWLSHARSRADAVLVEPPHALRRFGEGWREYVGKEESRELDQRRTELHAALDAVMRTLTKKRTSEYTNPLNDFLMGAAQAREELDALAQAINAAEETLSKLHATASKNTPQANWANLMRGAQLFRLDGKGGLSEQVATNSLTGRIVFLYFTAGWCPPCREFTPRLAAAAKVFLAERGSDAAAPFEVIQISSDHDEEGMRKYTRVSGARWIALSYPQRELQRELSSRFEVSQIPALVVLDVSVDGTTTVLSQNACADIESFLDHRDATPRAPWIEKLLTARAT